MMTQQHERPTDAPPRLDWNREVQELITLLVEAVLTQPDSEKKRVLDESIAPLFRALLTMKKVSGIGLIWMALIGSGYRDYAQQLSPHEAWRNQDNRAEAPGSFAVAAAPKETSDVA
jgi:hypothetical protein